jgi:hypothetical protein
MLLALRKNIVWKLSYYFLYMRITISISIYSIFVYSIDPCGVQPCGYRNRPYKKIQTHAIDIQGQNNTNMFAC